MGACNLPSMEGRRTNDEVHDETTANVADEGYAGSGWTTTKQAAKVLGVSRRSVQAYVRRGLLEAREEGEGVSKTFYVSIDSLNALRNRRNEEAGSPDVFAEGSSQVGDVTNHSENPGEALRHAIDRLEARTVEATELRVRLELTERAQSTLEKQLAEERRRREDAEEERDELRQRLEAAPETPRALETDAEAPKGAAAPRPGTVGPQTSAEGPEEAALDATETGAEDAEEVDTPEMRAGPQAGAWGPEEEEETARRPWWIRWFGG